MSELTDLLLQTTDPVSAILLVVIVGYLRQIKRDLEAEVARVRERTEELEQRHMDSRVAPWKLPGRVKNDD
jgi:hypothetical protein